MDLSILETEELIDIYAFIPEILKDRGVIRSRNFLGDLGEYLAIQHYNRTPGLPNLQAAPQGTQNIDAISRNGDRYSIKATRTNTTGVFYGLADPETDKIDRQKFEHLIILQFYGNLKTHRIIELDWPLFIKHKRWHSRMRAWNVSLTQSLLKDAKVHLDRSP